MELLGQFGPFGRLPPEKGAILLGGAELFDWLIVKFVCEGEQLLLRRRVD